jgi:hypothetical protein
MVRASQLWLKFYRTFGGITFALLVGFIATVTVLAQGCVGKGKNPVKIAYL